MRTRLIHPVRIVTILVILGILIAGCAAEEATEPPVSTEEEAETLNETPSPLLDYVFCTPEGTCPGDGAVKITIPKKENIYTIEKDPSKPTEIDIMSFSQEQCTIYSEELVLDFCVQEKAACVEVENLSPSMIIEVKPRSDFLESNPEAKLCYADTIERAWKPFEYQWKCGDYTIALISNWPEDPQVIWGE